MVINHQGEQAQRLHPLLAQKLSQNIALYKQEEQQADVWQTLGGEKDDFFIYDRCGRLTHHISLPYSIIGQGHVETAIKETYCKRICGDCIHEPDADGTPAVDGATGHDDHGHGHHHGHHHGHGHGHHGGHGHGHGNDHGQHHGNHHGAGHDHGQGPSEQGIGPQEQDGQVVQTPQHLDFSHMQLVADMPQKPQGAQGAPVMQRP
uniref:Selenoprotein P N-terminal domain-containing protein n=1 Tax=Sphaeramia orbicularis TaxID=375764 RepID=A0A672ZJT1_9TELE